MNVRSDAGPDKVSACSEQHKVRQDEGKVGVSQGQTRWVNTGRRNTESDLTGEKRSDDIGSAKMSGWSCFIESDKLCGWSGQHTVGQDE